jgi:hypothetical protein
VLLLNGSLGHKAEAKSSPKARARVVLNHTSSWRTIEANYCTNAASGADGRLILVVSVAPFNDGIEWIAVISLPLEASRKLRAKTQPEQCCGGHRPEADE